VSLKPDIVHLNSSKMGVLGSLAAERAGIQKIIYTAHGFVFNEPLGWLRKKLYMLAERVNAKHVSKIITVSEHDKKTGATAGIPAHKMITIHNGASFRDDYFLSRAAARDELRAYIDIVIPKNAVIIGCIANFYHSKGIDILLKSMARRDEHAIIIGDGENRKALEALIKKLRLTDTVSLPGVIPNASRLLRAFDVFVLPSRKEGLPYVLLEASAARVPVVATEVGGIPEVIQDGINGYLVRPNDPKELQKALQRALEKPRVPLIYGFCRADMVAKTMAVYTDA